MKIAEIKQAVDDGKNVYWASDAYKVIKDNIGHYLICSTFNNYCIGLTNQVGDELNGREDQFYIVG